MEDFIGYIYDHQLSNDSLKAVRFDGRKAVIEAHQGRSGTTFLVEFRGVDSFMFRRAEGKLITRVREMRADKPLKRFVFEFWENAAELEIVAKEILVKEPT